MLSTTCEGVAPAPPGRAGGAEAAAGAQLPRQRGAQSGGGRIEGLGVQEWPDGSSYEGEFVNGFKHGKGKYTWRNGEYYEGSFYRDYRHGDGVYYWPTGHKFIGKFYLNRKEAYGQQLFPDGSTFQGLYQADQRFGPGVSSYPDGRQDVGLWVGERLLRLCTAVEEGFSLKNFPGYVAFMDPAATTDSVTQPPIISSSLKTKARTHFEIYTDRDLLSDENFIHPPGMESYSTDGDHLPLPPGRRRELDHYFYGELWEPDIYPPQGYERDPLSTLPLQARMRAHIHKHRLQAENVGWDVAAVLSLKREGFGPKGPLEVNSERLIQLACRGELQAVSQILQTSLVHPDAADARGHTALIAATVNSHNDVIQLLLDMGADIDKLNCEGMSALAVSHVLYYPFQSLHTTLAEPPAKAQILRSPSARGSSPLISHADFTADTPRLQHRPRTTDTTLNSQSHLSDHTTEEVAEHISHHSSKLSNGSELITERCLGLNEPETPADTEHTLEEERDEDSKQTERERDVQEREESSHREDEGENKGEERNVEELDENEVKGQERVVESIEEDVESREEFEGGAEERERHPHEEDKEESVLRSIQVSDGHIALGSVQWKEGQTKQGKNKALSQQQTFDSACSVSSYSIRVTEEAMQHSAEALSRTGICQRSDTRETVRKMAAMKTEHHVRLNTLKLLLERGADPNVSKVPMPVLFLAVMAADTEAVRRLLLCGAHTDIPLPPERKGHYPLHVAAALPGSAGPRITELLLHAVTDPDAQACDQDEIYHPDWLVAKVPELVSTDERPHPAEGGRTALHVACQRDRDYRNSSKVVALLLSHRARTDLLWSGHSPLSLAIASGNDLAVEELLKGGADPNIPLSHGVGNALCALANINYHSGGNRAKMLDMLDKAGADILMPVMVGDVVGTAVDFAHSSFNQDLRIANTPFHALNMRERETFKARHQLLSMMGDLLRRTAGQREIENLKREKQLTLNVTSSTERFAYTGAGAITLNGPLHRGESLPVTGKHRKPLFKFCYHCGRSAHVKLTSCSRCRKVFYCSRACKLKAWDERHKEECIRESASGEGIQKRVLLKSQRGPWPVTVTLKSKTVPMPLSFKLKSQRVLKPLRTEEKVAESELNLKENYSCN